MVVALPYGQMGGSMMAIGGKVSSKVSIGCVTVYVSWPSLFLIFPDTFTKVFICPSFALSDRSH